MIRLGDPAATEAAGAALGRVARAGDVVTLSGALGAGKTSFARGVLRGLGHAGEVPSPSFTLVETYAPPGVRLPVWHVDLYRLGDPAEVAALALDEAADALLLIEWPERLGAALPDALALVFNGAGEAERRLTWVAAAGWEGRWPSR